MTALPQGQNLCDVSGMTPLSFLCAGLKLSLAVLSPEAKVRVRTLAARSCVQWLTDPRLCRFQQP